MSLSLGAPIRYSAERLAGPADAYGKHSKRETHLTGGPGPPCLPSAQSSGNEVPGALRKWGPFGTHPEEQRELGQNDEKIQNGAET